MFYSARRLQEGEATHLPVVEDGEAEGLSLCVRAQVCLKAKGVDGREESLDGVQGGPGHWRILRHMTSTNSKHNCNVRASKEEVWWWWGAGGSSLPPLQGNNTKLQMLLLALTTHCLVKQNSWKMTLPHALIKVRASG